MIAEWTLLVVGGLAVRRAGFAVPLVAPLAWGFLACVPMALVVQLVGSSWPAAAARGVWLDGIALSAVVGLGALTWLATLVSASRLAPGRVRQLTGDVRYP